MLHFPAIFCIAILQDKGILDGQESHDTVVYTCQTSGEEGQMMEVEINRKARMWLESMGCWDGASDQWSVQICQVLKVTNRDNWQLVT